MSNQSKLYNPAFVSCTYVTVLANSDTSDDESDYNNNYEFSIHQGKCVYYKRLVKRIFHVLTQNCARQIDLEEATDQLLTNCLKLNSSLKYNKTMVRKLEKQLHFLMNHDGINFSQRRILIDCYDIIQDFKDLNNEIRKEQNIAKIQFDWITKCVAFLMFFWKKQPKKPKHSSCNCYATMCMFRYNRGFYNPYF